MEYLKKEDNFQIVTLSQNLERCSELQQLAAKLTENYAQFVQFNENRKSKQFRLTDAEADVFTEAWTAFRAEQQARNAAEATRMQALVDEAYALAASCPAITIKRDDSDDSWKVVADDSIPYHSSWDYKPEHLLASIKMALEMYTASVKEIAAQAAEKERRQAVIDEAKKILEQYPMIQVQVTHLVSAKEKRRVSIAEPELQWTASGWARTPDEFLAQVKEAQAVWQKHLDTLQATAATDSAE
jgi:hypothetical protein